MRCRAAGGGGTFSLPLMKERMVWDISIENTRLENLMRAVGAYGHRQVPSPGVRVTTPDASSLSFVPISNPLHT